jgi:hypothetical protein
LPHLGKCPSSEFVVFSGKKEEKAETYSNGFLDYEELLRLSAPESPASECIDQYLAVIMCAEEPVEFQR